MGARMPFNSQKQPKMLSLRLSEESWGYIYKAASKYLRLCLYYKLPEPGEPKLTRAIQELRRARDQALYSYFARVKGPRTKLSDPNLDRRLIKEALRQANGNRDEAAKLLGISRASFYRRFKKLNIPRALRGIVLASN